VSDWLIQHLNVTCAREIRGKWMFQ